PPESVSFSGAGTGARRLPRHRRASGPPTATPSTRTPRSGDPLPPGTTPPRRPPTRPPDASTSAHVSTLRRCRCLDSSLADVLNHHTPSPTKQRDDPHPNGGRWRQVGGTRVSRRSRLRILPAGFRGRSSSRNQTCVGTLNAASRSW